MTLRSCENHKVTEGKGELNDTILEIQFLNGVIGHIENIDGALSGDSSLELFPF